MTPDLLFHPVFDEAEALAGMPHGEVVHPAPKHRIDQLHHPVHKLGLESPKDILELTQQRRTLLQLRRVVRSPHLPADTAQASEIKPEKAEAFPTFQLHDVTLLFIDLDL